MWKPYDATISLETAHKIWIYKSDWVKLPHSYKCYDSHLKKGWCFIRIQCPQPNFFGQEEKQNIKIQLTVHCMHPAIIFEAILCMKIFKRTSDFTSWYRHLKMDGGDSKVRRNSSTAVKCCHMSFEKKRGIGARSIACIVVENRSTSYGKRIKIQVLTLSNQII
jgi:hypothetical protein